MEAKPEGRLHAEDDISEKEVKFVMDSLSGQIRASPESVKGMLEHVVDFNTNFQCPICLALAYEPH